MKKTLDERALELLLNGDSTGLSKLAGEAEKFVTGRTACPECGNPGPHDWNDDSIGGVRTYCCSGCGMHFDVDR